MTTHFYLLFLIGLNSKNACGIFSYLLENYLYSSFKRTFMRTFIYFWKVHVNIYVIAVSKLFGSKLGMNTFTA